MTQAMPAIRRVIRPREDLLVDAEPLTPGRDLPLVLTPRVRGLHLATWANDNLPYLEPLLLRHGGILFRGFAVDSVAKFEEFAKAISPTLLPYTERTAPRRELTENIYTST